MKYVNRARLIFSRESGTIPLNDSNLFSLPAMTRALSGSMVAIVTPMDKRGAIDMGAYRALLEWHLDSGTEGIVVAGSTGESPTLSVLEHQQLIAETVSIVAGRTPVIAGVGANATQEAIELTRQAHQDGADAGLSVTPYYNKPTQEGLVRHYTAITDAAPLPLLLYDVPGRCAVGVDDETVARLASQAGIVGLKDAVGDASRARRLKTALSAAGHDDFLLLSGDDKSSRDYLLGGGDGVISVTANVFPSAMRAMVDAARRGDAEAAAAADAALEAFHVAQGVESNPIPVKAALLMLNKIDEGIRLPLTPLAERHRAEVRQAIEAIL